MADGQADRQEARPVVRFFHAPWSFTSRLQRQILNEVLADSHCAVECIEMDVSQGEAPGIPVAPTLVVFLGGEERGRLEGLHPAQAISRLLKQCET